MNDKVGVALEGVDQFRRAMSLADMRTRSRVGAAIHAGALRILAGAVARIHNVSGELASTGRVEDSKTALVSYVKFGYGKLPRHITGLTSLRRSARVRAANILQGRKTRGQSGKGIYGPVVERGDRRRHHAAHPYLIPALEQNRPAIVGDIRSAMQRGIDDVRAP